MDAVQRRGDETVGKALSMARRRTRRGPSSPGSISTIPTLPMRPLTSTPRAFLRQRPGLRRRDRLVRCPGRPAPGGAVGRGPPRPDRGRGGRGPRRVSGRASRADPRLLHLRCDAPRALDHRGPWAPGAGHLRPGPPDRRHAHRSSISWESRFLPESMARAFCLSPAAREAGRCRRSPRAGTRVFTTAGASSRRLGMEDTR